MKVKNLFKMSDLLGQYKNKFLHYNTQQNEANNTYEGAIEALNALQSNAEYLRNKMSIKLSQADEYKNTILQTQKYLIRSGLSLQKLDSLSVIHITGTKGKGSTSAYCESILRHQGYKTGFYSSPHLIEVRERIQINGKPLQRDKFTEYFWNVYNPLLHNRENPHDMPAYFKFLTVMAFQVFIQENIDVAVIEVGIGGEYDCTNVLRSVAVAGITPLALDHTALLGDTLEKIAWQKGGIMKEYTKVFTVPQPVQALKVLEKRSLERKATLKVVDVINPNEQVLKSDTQILNAALAVNLVKAWVTTSGKGVLSDQAITEGIEKCYWPGRYQTIYTDHITYYLDGAHTLDSIKSCVKWFTEETKNSANKKILLFNVMGDRDSEQLLRQLQPCDFRAIYFAPNVAKLDKNEDAVNFNITTDVQMKRCYAHQNNWLRISKDNPAYSITNVIVFSTVSEVLENLAKGQNYDILVTGSLHLVGAVLSLISSNVN